MTWTVKFDKKADKQFGQLGRNAQLQIQSFIDNKLSKSIEPRKLGKQLVGNHKGLWRFRTGDYRLICEAHNKELILLVIHVGHRKDIYR